MSTSRNSKVKAVTREFGTFREKTEQEQVESSVKKRMARAGVFSKAPDIIAGDTFHMRNHPIPKGKELFPAEWRMQFVDLFYPYTKAEDGTPAPLFIDMPVTVHDVALCERKLPILQERGLRYTYIKVGEGEFEGTCRLMGQDPAQVRKDQDATRRKSKGETA